jgi:MFS family permease
VTLRRRVASPRSHLPASLIPTTLPQGLAAFKHRNYRLFWFGQLVSVTGTWMQSLAQAWLILTLTSSAFLLGLVSVFQFAPVLVLGLFAGVVADRVPKRNLLVVTQALAGLLAGALALLVFTERVELWHVYAIALCLGVVNAFDMPARQAFVVEMVGKEDLTNAIALNSSLFNAARIAGPAVAGALLAVFGPAICFGLNAVSYIAVIAGLLLMRLDALPRRAAGRGLAQVREGLRYVRRSPALLRPIVLVGLVATFGMNFNVWVPLLARHDLDGGASGFGFLMAASGFGSLAGALALAFLVGSVRHWMLFSTAAALGTLNLVLALAGELQVAIPLAMLVLAGIGFSSTTTMAMANTTVQSSAPDELRGRIMAVYMTVFAGTAPFGALVAGAIANRYGAPASIAAGGLVTLLAVAAVALERRPLPLPRPALRRR